MFAVKRTVAALGVLGALIAFGGRAVSAGQSRPSPVREYAVQAGDTLWSLAGPLGGDRRAVVRLLIELNDLDSAALRPGQVLRLPAH